MSDLPLPCTTLIDLADIPCKSGAQYLELFLDSKLISNAHISYALFKTNAAIAMSPLIKSQLIIENKKAIYTRSIRSIMT